MLMNKEMMMNAESRHYKSDESMICDTSFLLTMYDTGLRADLSVMTRFNILRVRLLSNGPK